MEKLLSISESFHKAMVEKLQANADRGNSWESEESCPEFLLMRRLKEQIEKKNWTNLANYAMFMWFRENERKKLQSSLDKK